MHHNVDRLVADGYGSLPGEPRVTPADAAVARDSDEGESGISAPNFTPFILAFRWNRCGAALPTCHRK